MHHVSSAENESFLHWPAQPGNVGMESFVWTWMYSLSTWLSCAFYNNLINELIRQASRTFVSLPPPSAYTLMNFWPADPKMKAKISIVLRTKILCRSLFSHPTCCYWLLVCNHVIHTTAKDWNTLIKRIKISNLLHQGRGVQEGQEVQAVQAGRGYHRYQEDREDPGIGNKEKNRNIESVANKLRETERKTQRASPVTWLPVLLLHQQNWSLCFIFYSLCVSWQAHSLATVTKAALHLEEMRFIPPPPKVDYETNQEWTTSGHVTSGYRNWVRTVTDP